MQELIAALPDFVEKVDGAVFYIDGGQRPVLNKAKATFGMHAYFYSDEVAKKGHGAKEFLPTPTTYVEKAKVSADEKCTVLKYYDAFGPSAGGTSMTAEMDALIEALTIIKDSNLYDHVKRIFIYSDSQITVYGTTQWLEGWKRRGWMSSNGTPVANRNLWEKIDKLWNEVTALVDITFEWVKGHADNYGNTIADYMASTGLFHIEDRKGTISNPEGYYAADHATSKLLLDSKLYHLYEIKPEIDGKAQYLTFSHPSQGFDVKDDVGKRVRDFGIGIVRLNESEPVLDEIIRTSCKFNERIADVPIIVNLQNILKPAIYKEILEGSVGRYNVTSEGHVKALTGENLLTIVNPSRLAYKLKPIYSEIGDVLDDYLDGVDRIGVTDITDKFYDKVEKKGVTSLKFKLASESSIQVHATFRRDVNDITTNLTRPVTITFGNDTPQRRTFNAIAGLEPKISVVTWEECESTYRYALVVETTEGVGIWCSCYDNSEFIR